MLILEQVLEEAELAGLRSMLDAAPFRDGRLSALGPAKEVKRNSQAAGEDPTVIEIKRGLRNKLAASQAVRAYARPVRWSPLLISRYGEGDAYGEHVDAPFMLAEDGGEMRADLSFTLFLENPASYEGGELVLQADLGSRPVKLPAGAAVVYPTSLLHAVNPVRSGMRRAAVGWIESRIRNPEQRSLLYDFERAVGALPDDAVRRRLTLIFANLIKMWS